LKTAISSGNFGKLLHICNLTISELEYICLHAQRLFCEARYVCLNALYLGADKTIIGHIAKLKPTKCFEFNTYLIDPRINPYFSPEKLLYIVSSNDNLHHTMLFIYDYLGEHLTVDEKHGLARCIIAGVFREEQLNLMKQAYNNRGRNALTSFDEHLRTTQNEQVMMGYFEHNRMAYSLVYEYQLTSDKEKTLYWKKQSDNCYKKKYIIL